jgi:Tol biopolymer transport system component
MGAPRNALIVATSKYLDTRLPPLEAPRQDAGALRRVLESEEIGSFSVQVALNQRVQALRRTLESFFADRAVDDLLLVHFSCHGLKDDEGQLYLAATDTEMNRLRSTAVDADWLRKLMDGCRSEKIAVLLDCCFGGAFATSMTRRVGVDAPGVREHLGGGSGRVVITASNAVQYAFEGGNRVGTPEPSVFTQALVQGLDSGEADRNEDGDITINELFEYVADKVRRTTPSQTPTKWEFNLAGDWVVAQSRRVSIQMLPPDLLKLLTSPDNVHRLAALTELRYLLGSDDPKLAESAGLAVQQLAADDSQKVSTAARRLLQEDAAERPRDTRRRGRPRKEPAPPKDVPDAAPAPATPMADAVVEADLAGREPPAVTAPVDVAPAVAPAPRVVPPAPPIPPSVKPPAPATPREATPLPAAGGDTTRRWSRWIRIGVPLVIVIGLAAAGAAAGLGCLGSACGQPASPTPEASGGGAVTSPVASLPAVVAPPTGTIVFTATINGDDDLWVAAPDGTGMKPLVKAPGSQTEPFWSPDGSQVVYQDRQVGLRIVTADGAPLVTLTNDPGDNYPAWSPDGKSIAFVESHSEGKRDVYTLRLDALSDPPKRLTTDAVDDWDPSWSPAGDRIAFDSRRDGPVTIYTMAADGKDQTRLTTDGAIYDDPAWSPDGDWIAVTRRETGTSPKGVWLIRPDGSGLKPITTSGIDESDPTWSPDGRFLAFTRGAPTLEKIVVSDLEGHDIATFVPPGATTRWPDWH